MEESIEAILYYRVNSALFIYLFFFFNWILSFQAKELKECGNRVFVNGTLEFAPPEVRTNLQSKVFMSPYQRGARFIAFGVAPTGVGMTLFCLCDISILWVSKNILPKFA